MDMLLILEGRKKVICVINQRKKSIALLARLEAIWRASSNLGAELFMSSITHSRSDGDGTDRIPRNVVFVQTQQVNNVGLCSNCLGSSEPRANCCLSFYYRLFLFFFLFHSVYARSEAHP